MEREFVVLGGERSVTEERGAHSRVCVFYVL